METNETLQFFTDATATRGLGFECYFNSEWTYGIWDDEFLDDEPSIALLELFPIAVSMAIWGGQIENKCVTLRSDNKAAVAMVNKQTSKYKYCMALIMFIVMHCMHLNIDLKCMYIMGYHNKITDSISRLQWMKFQTLVPTAKPDPKVVPSELWPISMKRLMQLKL